MNIRALRSRTAEQSLSKAVFGILPAIENIAKPHYFRTISLLSALGLLIFLRFLVKLFSSAYRHATRNASIPLTTGKSSRLEYWSIGRKHLLPHPLHYDLILELDRKAAQRHDGHSLGRSQGTPLVDADNHILVSAEDILPAASYLKDRLIFHESQN